MPFLGLVQYLFELDHSEQNEDGVRGQSDLYAGVGSRTDTAAPALA
jgi:hypothetical protein